MIFADRKFLVVPGSFAEEDETESSEKIITENGGSIVSWRDRLERDITPQLVAVSPTVDFSHYNELSSLMVPTVTADWLRECVKMGKLVPTRPYSPDPRNFLSKVMVCCSGLSQGDTDAIKAGVRAVGGDHSDDLTRYTTHVIATDIETDRCQTALECPYDIKLVSPEWIDDCIKLQCKIDEKQYLLDTSQDDGGANASDSDLTGTFPIDQTPRLAVQSSVRHSLGSSLFEGKSFYLGSDLDLSERLKKTIIYLIETNSGTIADTLKDAKVYLGKWRQGEEYVHASKNRLVVGNLTWLYWMIIQQRWDTPLKRLMHYPEVKGGLPDMVNATISITNYTGDSRAYLQSLIESLGATYNGSLVENSTTHLIAAYGGGRKFDAAQKWGIKIVNHLWLEESFSMWQVQSETLPRYTHLPSRIDMTKLIGSTHLVPQVLKRFYGDAPELGERHHLPKRAASVKANMALYDSMMKENQYQKLKRGNALPELPEEQKAQSRKRGHDHDEDNHDGEPNDRSETGEIDETRELPSSPKGTPKATPRAKTQKGAQKNRGTPTRGQPARDTADLDDPVEASPVKASPAKASPIKASLAKASPAKAAKEAAASSSPASKKPKALEIIVTGVDDPPSRQKCAKAGLSLRTNPPARVLVAPRIMRTAKFISSLADVETCVVPAWLTASLAAGEPLPTDKYEIDSASLKTALQRSAEMRRQDRGLFTGHTFRIAADVAGGPKVVEQIVRAHGGEISKKKSEGLLIGADGSDVTLGDVVNSVLEMDASLLPL